MFVYLSLSLWLLELLQQVDCFSVVKKKLIMFSRLSIFHVPAIVNSYLVTSSGRMVCP
jgi:hypothetical protein